MVIIQMTQAELESTLRKIVEDVIKGKNSPTNDDLLSRKKTAEYLGVSFPTLNTWEKKGIIEPVRFGGRVFFKKSMLLKR